MWRYLLCLLALLATCVSFAAASSSSVEEYEYQPRLRSGGHSLITVDGDRELGKGVDLDDAQTEGRWLRSLGASDDANATNTTGTEEDAGILDSVFDFLGWGEEDKDNATSAPTPAPTATAPNSAPQADKNIAPTSGSSTTTTTGAEGGMMVNISKSLQDMVSGVLGGNGNDQKESEKCLGGDKCSSIPLVEERSGESAGAPTTTPTTPTGDGNMMGNISKSLQDMVSGIFGANGNDQKEGEKCLGGDKCGQDGNDKCLGGDKCGNTTIIILVAEQMADEKAGESASNGSFAPAPTTAPPMPTGEGNVMGNISKSLQDMFGGITGMIGGNGNKKDDNDKCLGGDKCGQDGNDKCLGGDKCGNTTVIILVAEQLAEEKGGESASTTSKSNNATANNTTPAPSSPPSIAPSSRPSFAPPSTAAPTACDVCKQDPKISNVPPAKTVCPGEYSLPMATEIAATDVCLNDLVNGTGTNAVTVSQKESFINNSTCAGTVVNVWSVHIETCNGSAPVTATQTLTIQDIEAPKFVDVVLPDAVFTCPNDFNETQLVPPFATDNCEANVNVQPRTASLQECNDVTVTWIASDECGNEATLSQTVKIDDAMAPILKSNTPPNVTLSCASELPSATTLTFTDNCAGDLIVNATDVNTGGSYCVGNVTKRTWEGPSDDCGNTATSIIQTLTVIDQAPPALPSELETVSLMCPKAFKLEDLMAPNATDDCSAPDAISVKAAAMAPTKCEDVVVTWTAQDECGNVFTSNQLVSFSDSLAPMPLNDTTPAPLQLNCSAPFPAPARLTFVDNCDNDVQVDSVDEDLGGSFCDGRLFKRKWEGPTDICGNRASEVTQTITFLDLEPPVLQSPLNEQQYTCPRDFALAQLPVPTVKDDCDESVTITSEATENKNCHNITVAWTATDVCNKKSQVNQTIFFSDREAPVLKSIPPQDLSLRCKDIQPDPEKLTFADNCGGDINVDPIQTPPAGSVCTAKVIERFWLGPTDDCQNAAQNYTQKITINDQENPVLPAAVNDLTFVCPQDFNLKEVAKPVATDDCSLAVTVTGVASDLNKCEPVSITWTAIDDCNKSSSVNQKVLFTDVTPPSVSGGKPTDLTVGCGQFPEEEKLVFFDYCKGDTVVLSVDSLPTGNVCEGQLFNRTWEGPSDDCGNTAEAVTQIITVKDLGAPDLPESMPDIVLFCHSDFHTNDLVPPNATDDCDKSVLVEKTVPPHMDKCAHEFDIVWTAIDECSKTDVVTQTVKFEGTQPPSITCPNVFGNYTGGGGTFTHGVDYGDCYSAQDVKITFEASCSACNGDSCNSPTAVSSNGAILTIDGAPKLSKLEWTAVLDYGCGVVQVQCSVGDCPA